MYTSTKKLLVDFMEESGSRIRAGKRRAVLDVWSGWLAALLNLDGRFEEPSVLPQSGGRYLLYSYREGVPATMRTQ